MKAMSHSVNTWILLPLLFIPSSISADLWKNQKKQKKLIDVALLGDKEKVALKTSCPFPPYTNQYTYIWFQQRNYTHNAV